MYFSATTPDGIELHVYDGNRVTLVQDLTPGSSRSIPSNLTVYRDKLYFAATTLETNRELYSYDGTEISLVQDIIPGGGSAEGSDPNYLTVYKNKLYFSARSSCL